MSAYRTIFFLPLLLAFHCGGRTVLTDERIPQEDAGTDARVVRNHPPHADARAPVPCATPRPADPCIDQCWSDAQDSTDAICDDGTWTCPDGYFFESECTGGACAYQPATCCDSCGQYVETICSADYDCGQGEHICAPDSPPATQPCDGGIQDDDDFEDASGR